MLKVYKVFPIYLIGIIPLFIIWNIMAEYTISVPFWDNWHGVIPLIIKAYNHSLSIEDFFAEHNSHRLVFTRVVFLINYLWFSGQALPILMTNFIAQLAQVGIIFLSLRQDPILKNSPIARAILFVLFMFILFPAQAGQVWVWDFLIQQTFSTLFYTIAIYLLTTAPLSNIRFSAAIVISLVATMTSANGLIIWPAGVLGLLLTNNKRFCLLYFIIAVVTIVLYTHGVSLPSSATDTSISLYKRIGYFLCFLGSPVSKDSPTVSIFWGLISLIIYTLNYLYYFLRDKNTYSTSKMPFWSMLGLITIGSGFLAALGRFDGELNISLSDRYTILCAPYWCSIVIILIRQFIVAPKLRAYIALLQILLAFNFFKTAQSMPNTSYYYQRNIHAQALALRANHYIVNPEIPMVYLYPVIKEALAGLKWLKIHNLSIFAAKENPKIDIIGASIVKLGLTISNQSIPGSLEKFKLDNVNMGLNTCKYSFIKALAANGWVKYSKNIDSIYLLNKDNIIVGVGSIYPRHLWKQYDYEAAEWRGFVSTNIPKDNVLHAFLKQGNTLFPLENADQKLLNTFKCSMDKKSKLI